MPAIDFVELRRQLRLGQVLELLGSRWYRAGGRKCVGRAWCMVRRGRVAGCSPRIWGATAGTVSVAAHAATHWTCGWR
jgi:hypothetical protein